VDFTEKCANYSTYTLDELHLASESLLELEQRLEEEIQTCQQSLFHMSNKIDEFPEVKWDCFSLRKERRQLRRQLSKAHSYIELVDKELSKRYNLYRRIR